MNDRSNAHTLSSRSIIINLVLYTFKEIAMFEKVKQILIDELQVDESLITLDAELANDLGINSIELADLVMICEDKFDIEINDDNIGQFVTIRDVVNYLETL
jgi:acyl carrier protein